MDFIDISKKQITVRKFAQTPVEEEKYRKYSTAAPKSDTEG